MGCEGVNIAFMCRQVEQHIAAVEAFYKPIITGNQNGLAGGNRLWGQFEQAIAAYHKKGKTALRQVTERVNELVVARIILDDKALPQGKVQYEPKIGTATRRIDFVVPSVRGGRLYIEVKTVHPRTEDSEENWERYKRRREMHTKNTRYTVKKDGLGAELYGNSFSARSKFMEYAREFETRLAEANEAQPGRGVLVFCGNGWDWRLTELEDFADFYCSGRHRPYDAFGKMEAEWLRAEGIELRRNIEAFSFVKRPVRCVKEEQFIAKVRGLIQTLDGFG